MMAHLAIAVFAFACSAPPNAERVSLKIGVRPLFTVAPIYIAQAAGLYAEQGLDVELIPIEGVAMSVPLLIQGKLDVLPGPVSPSLFNAIQRGGRLRIVGDKGSTSVTTARRVCSSSRARSPNEAALFDV